MEKTTKQTITFGIIFFIIGIMFILAILRLVETAPQSETGKITNCLDNTSENWKENEDCFNWACSQFNLTNKDSARNFKNGDIWCSKEGLSIQVNIDFSVSYQPCKNYVYRQYLFERCYYGY